MANFFDAIHDELNHSDENKTLTDNGAVAYASAGDSLVDFAYSVNNLRNKTPEQIAALFERCYTDNPMMATKMMFQIGDVREGKGERRTFNTCLRYMALAHPEVAKALLPLVPEYTRWSHVAEMVTCGEPSVQRFARQMIGEQLRKDYETAKLIDNDAKLRAELTAQYETATTDEEKAAIQKQIQKIPHREVSLCAKWAPALGAKKDGHHKIALKLAQSMGLSNKEYRQMRSTINAHLNIAERALSAKNLESIDFEHLTSAQQLKYADTLKKNNGEAYQDYLDKVAAGEANMNASVATPADIVHKYTTDGEWRWKVQSYDQTLEEMWKHLKDTAVQDGNGVIVVRDDSGSMTAQVSDGTSMTCEEVATALALYCAEKLPGEFNNKFISFSSHPKYLDVSNFDTLHDKLKYAYEHSEVSNTDVKAVFDLMLKTAVNHQMSQSDIPGCVLMLSDMQFDAATVGSPSSALFEQIRDEWKEAGYEMPTLAFWNLSPTRSVVPVVDDRGVVLLSGFTTDNLDMVMNGGLAEFTPAKQLEIVLSKPRYDAVEQAFNEGIAAERIAENKVSRPTITFADYLPDEGYSLVTNPTELSEQEEGLDEDGFDEDDLDW